MKRKLLIGAAVTILFIMGISTAFAKDYLTAVQDTNSTYQRSPDCKYPPCD